MCWGSGVLQTRAAKVSPLGRLNWVGAADSRWAGVVVLATKGANTGGDAAAQPINRAHMSAAVLCLMCAQRKTAVAQNHCTVDSSTSADAALAFEFPLVLDCVFERIVDIKEGTCGGVINHPVVTEFFTSSVVAWGQLKRQQIVVQDVGQAIVQFSIFEHISLAEVTPLCILPTNAGHAFGTQAN